MWESLYNADFTPLEFVVVRSQAGLTAITMSASKWTNGVDAIGIVSKAGRYGGTYAHSDIAFEYCIFERECIHGRDTAVGFYEMGQEFADKGRIASVNDRSGHLPAI